MLESESIAPSPQIDAYQQQIFLVFKTLDRSSWPTHLSNTRRSYESLRDHYLRAIRHPDEFDSSVDPLSEHDEVRTSLFWLSLSEPTRY